MSSPASIVSFGVAVVCYAAASALFYWAVARAREASVRWLAPALLAVGAVGHGVYVTVASFVAHVCPIYSLHFLLSTASLLATIAYLAARVRFRVDALGVFVAPLGLVLTLATFFVGSAAPERHLPASFIGLHALSALVGFAMFLLASGAAVLYLVQERRLKKQRLPGRGLPALDALDRAVHRFLVAGFPLLTLAVITGTVWAKQLEHGSPEEIFRNVLSYATWLMFGAVLLLRVVAGWRGRRAAYGTVAGFACELVVLALYVARPLFAGRI